VLGVMGVLSTVSGGEMGNTDTRDDIRDSYFVQE
jgi:hypothetical protein